MNDFVQRALRAGPVMAAVVALLLVFLTNHAVQELIDDSQRVVRTMQAREGAENILKLLLEEGSTRHAWRVTGEDSQRVLMEQAGRAALRKLATVRALTSDSPVQQARLHQLEPLVRERLELSARRPGPQPPANPPPPGAREVQLEGIRLITEIRALVNALVAEEDALLAKRTAASELSARLTVGIIVTVSVLGILGILGAAGLLRHELRVREQAESSLRQGEERFRGLLEAAPDAMIIVDGTGCIVLVNAQAERIFGWNREALVGQKIEVLVPERVQSAHVAMRTGYAAHPDARAMGARRELSARRKDGSEFPVEISLSPLQTDRGQLITAAVRDVTVRRQADTALRETTARFRTLFDRAPVGVVVIDPATARVLECNELAARQLGYTLEEFTRLRIGDFEAAELPEQTCAHIQKVLTTGQDTFETRHRTKAGALRDVLVSTQNIELAGQTVFQCIFLDITERKHAEAAQRASELLHHSLMDHLPLAVFRKDTAGRFVYGNPRFCEALGRPWLEIAGRTDAELFPAELAAKYQRDDARVLATGTSLELNEENCGTDGVVRHVHVIKNPVHGPAGGIIGVQGIFEDVTARHRAEAALRESERRFRQLVHTLPAAVYACDAEGRITLFNEAAVALWGREPEIGQDLWGGAWRLFKPDGTPLRPAESPMAETLRTGRPVRGQELVIERPDGTRSRVLPHPVATRDSTGALTGGVNMLVDLTERLQAEEALARERRLLRTVIDNLPGYIFAKDAAGRYTVSNRAHVRLLGARSEAELRDKTVFDFFPPETARSYAGDDELMMRTGQPVLNREECVKLNGGCTWYQLTKVPLRDEADGVVGLVGIKQDITAQKLAEESVRQAEAKYREIFDNTVEGIVQTDPSGRIITANSTMARLLGYDSPEELIAACLNMDRDVHVKPGDRTSLLRRARTGGRDFIQCQFKRRDGRLVWVSLNVRVVRDERGEPRYFEGTCVDITESRRLEEQLRQSQKMEAVGQLAGGIAHDFNNIIGAIIGNVDLIRLLPGDHPGREESLDAIHSASRRAADLVRQILAFSRRQEAKRQPMELRTIIREVLKLLRATIPASVEFEVDLATTPTVLADPSEIHQVAMNLCTNAWHALPDGAGVIRVALAETEVDEALARVHPDLRPGRYVRLSITDNGCGMDAATLARIFDPFFTTKPAGQGTGLGLAVVHGILKNHDGGIVVESQPGRGTTFHLYFPVFATSVAEATVEPKALPQGNGAHILFVDDEKPLIEIGTTMLKRIGYRVTGTTNPAEALTWFRERPGEFALVLTDLNMPGLDGAALARQLRETRPDIRLILATGYSASVDAAAALQLGFSELLPKPYDFRSLAEAVGRALNLETHDHDHT
ncbi:MAG: multi-sensor hybrid histidine kinase [Limisphaerales bacterium]|nr:MAG: multi-sensor hybrid histidine kinase [Limisphaerales bacterium]